MKIAFSIVASLAAHAAVVLAICAGAMNCRAWKSASIEVSTLELSFSEKKDDTKRESCPEMSASAEAPRPPMPELEPPPPERAEESAPAEPWKEVLANPPEEPFDMVESVFAAAESAPVQARVDALARPAKSIRPVYPQSSRSRGEEGDVVVEFTVDAAGAARDVAVVQSCGHRDLDNAAREAVLGARFIPAKKDGVNVESRARMPLVFRLTGHLRKAP